MMRTATPMDLFSTGLRAWNLWTEASTVIGLRVLGMAGVLPQHSDENQRMLSEKPAAFAASAMAGTRAALRGARPDQIANAAMRPLKRKTAANAKRLKKGPKG